MNDMTLGHLNGHLETIATTLGELLVARSLRLVTCESCTGGGLSQIITGTEGASQWFERGYVAYSNDAKKQMLAVKVGTMKKHGAVSEQVVAEMALGALKKSGADIAVAMSGVAGPNGGTDEKPVGTVWFAWAYNGTVDVSKMCFEGDRSQIRQGTVMLALQGLVARIPAWCEPNSSDNGDTADSTTSAVKGVAEAPEEDTATKPKAKTKAKSNAKPKAKSKAKPKAKAKPKDTPKPKAAAKPKKAKPKKAQAQSELALESEPDDKK